MGFNLSHMLMVTAWYELTLGKVSEASCTDQVHNIQRFDALDSNMQLLRLFKAPVLWRGSIMVRAAEDTQLSLRASQTPR